MMFERKMALRRLAHLPFAYLAQDTAFSGMFNPSKHSPAIKPPAPLFAVENQRLVFTGPPPVAILDGASLDIAPGAVVGVTGASGAGKSLLFTSALGLLRQRETPHLLDGKFWWAGQPIFPNLDAATAKKYGGIAPGGLLGKHIAFIFQEALAAFHPDFSLRRQFTAFLALHGIPRRQRPEIMEAGLRALEVHPAKLDNLPRQLSGGTLQRIHIAMALALRPALIIADECTSALDVTTQARVVELLCSAVAASGAALLFIAHDLELVADIAPFAWHIQDGRVIRLERQDLRARQKAAWSGF